MKKNTKKKQTKLIVLSAPSGTGKSTLARMLLKENPGFKVSISYTTRPPRGTEENGKDYFFINDDAFQKMIQQNEFLEHAQVFRKHFYGTSKKTVESLLDSGFNVLFDIDVQGANSIKKIYNERCITIFILPPSLEELESRLRSRQTDSKASIEARLKTATEELQQAAQFDYQVINEELQTAYDELKDILKNEGCL